jgi:serine/threonine protein kinase
MIGRTIAHYRVEKKLGEGGMGEVYLAEDTSLDRRVALKFLSKSLVESHVAHMRFLREAKSAAALDHPFMCSIHEVGQTDEGEDFIVMEYVRGRTLKNTLEEGHLSLDEALKIGIEVAEALEEAHEKGIVHRDLKPANIMLTVKGHAKVMDFGLAKYVDSSSAPDAQVTAPLTKEGSTLGTINYMSPEQIRGETIDTRSDIFSFGVILYEVLTGVHPFRRDSSMGTVSAILGQDPPPLSDHLAKPPGQLQDVVGSTMCKSSRPTHCACHLKMEDRRL